MNSSHDKPRVGERVILLALPPGFLDDHAAIPEKAVDSTLSRIPLMLQARAVPGKLRWLDETPAQDQQ
jgi:hypothetical protein